MKNRIAILGGILMSLSTHAATDVAKSSLYDFSVKTLAGESVKLDKYKGKPLLVVNVASECGYTPQYEGLQKIYDRYKAQGFVILGFPSNQFGAQEPGTNSEIAAFCDRKFHVKFPMFEKADVKGPAQQPLYSWLQRNAATHEDVAWNFEKFLISKDGKIVGRYKSKVTPESEELTKAIETALK